MPSRIDIGPEGGPFVAVNENNNDLELQDINGNVIAKWDETAGHWDFANNSLTNLAAVETEEVISAEPDVNYGNPLWLARTQALASVYEFVSLDGFDTTTSGSASITLQSTNITLDTGGTSGSIARVEKGWGSQIHSTRDPTWDKDRWFAIGYEFNDFNDRIDYIVTGNVESGNQGFGFKVEDGDLLGVAHDGTSETTTTVDSTPANRIQLDAHLRAGNEVVFYVDGVESGSISTVPTSDQWADRPLQLTVENTAAVERNSKPRPNVRVVQEP